MYSLFLETLFAYLGTGLWTQKTIGWRQRLRRAEVSQVNDFARRREHGIFSKKANWRNQHQWSFSASGKLYIFSQPIVGFEKPCRPASSGRIYLPCRAFTTQVQRFLGHFYRYHVFKHKVNQRPANYCHFHFLSGSGECKWLPRSKQNYRHVHGTWHQHKQNW